MNNEINKGLTCPSPILTSSAFFRFSGVIITSEKKVGAGEEM